MGDVPFDDFAASEPEAPTTQPMTDEEIINLVHTENDVRTENWMMRKRKIHLQN